MTGSRTAWLKLFNWGKRGTGKCVPFQVFVTLYSLSHGCDLKSWLRLNSMTSFKINLHEWYWGELDNEKFLTLLNDAIILIKFSPPPGYNAITRACLLMVRRRIL